LNGLTKVESNHTGEVVEVLLEKWTIETELPAYLFDLFRTCLETRSKARRVSRNQTREDESERDCCPDNDKEPPEAIEESCQTKQRSLA